MEPGYYYNLLFHEHTPTSGHFEPLLSYKSKGIEHHILNQLLQNIDKVQFINFHDEINQKE